MVRMSLAGLLGAPIDPGAIYAGKLAGTIVLLGAMQLVDELGR